MIEKRKTGINIIGDAPWGIHFCQFYKTKKDLTDILVPYFKAGLENNEFCMWVTSEPLKVEDAKRSLRKAVKNLDEYIKTGQIEILDYSQWYTKTGKFDADKVLKGLVEKEKQAIEKGFDGLRLTGNISWLEKRDWKSFVDYEVMVNNVIHNYKMLAICSYSLDKCKAPEILDVMGVHQFVIINRNGKWTIIESTERKMMEEELIMSGKKYRELAELLPGAVFELDINGKFTYANRLAFKMAGYTQNDMEQGLNALQMFITEERERVRNNMKLILTGQGLSPNDYTALRKDGTTYPVSIYSSPILNEKGNPIGLRGIIIDITERKQAEEMLQHQRDALSTHTRILSAILRTRDLDKLLNTILEEVMFFLHVEFGCIHLVQGDDLVLCCSKGFSDTSCAHLLSFSAENPPDWIRKLLFTKEQLSEYGIMPSFAKREGIQSWTCIPLELPPLREGETTTKWLGTLILCSRGVNALDKERIETLEIISHKIALAIDRAQSYRDAQERLFRLQALRDIDKAIIRQLDLREVMNVVLERVPEELGADAAAVSLLDEKQKETKIFAMRLPNGTIIEEEVFTLAESLLHWFVDKQEPVIIYNLLQDPRIQMNRNHLRNAGIVSYLGVPLIVQNKTIGILHILTTRPMIFRDEDVEFFRTLAGQTAIALENARVSEDLRESEKKYRIIFETTGTATTIVEEDTTISLANTEFERLSGYSKEEIEGKKSWKEFVVKEDLERMKGYHIQRRIEPNAASKNYEFRFIDRQGNIKDIFLNIDMIPGTKKSVASLLDITERKRSEEQLIQSETRYKYLSELTSDYVYSCVRTKDTPYRIDWIGGAFERITGYTTEELLQSGCWTFLVHPEDTPKVRQHFSKTEPGQTDSCEFRIITKDSSIRWIKDFSRCESYGDYPVYYRLYGASQDITERKHAEEELRNTKEYLEKLTNALPDVIFTVKFPERTHEYLNSSGERILGYNNQECIGKSTRMFYANEDEFIDLGKKLITAIEHGKEIVYTEHLLKRKNGEVFPGELTLTFLKEDGKVIRLIGIVRDITERKQAEDRERLAHEVLDLLNRSESASDTIRDILLLVKKSMGIEAMGIRLQEGDDFPYYKTRGFPEDFVQAERYLCAYDEAGKIVRDGQGNPVLECMCGNVLCGRTDATLPFFTEEGSFWTNSTTDLLASTTEEDRKARTRNRCNGEGYESVALIPLRSGGEIIGLLQLNDRRRNLFKPEIIRFCEGLGASIGITLSRKHTEEALRESEEKFRTLVEGLSEAVYMMTLPDGIYKYLGKVPFQPPNMIHWWHDKTT
jgi:PAS domain S-box-containing protein